MAQSAGISKKELGRSIRLLLRELHLRSRPPRASDFLPRLISELQLDTQVENRSRKLLVLLPPPAPSLPFTIQRTREGNSLAESDEPPGRGAEIAYFVPVPADVPSAVWDGDLDRDSPLGELRSAVYRERVASTGSRA